MEVGTNNCSSLLRKEQVSRKQSGKDYIFDYAAVSKCSATTSLGKLMCYHYTTAAKFFDTSGVYSTKFGIATDLRFPA